MAPQADTGAFKTALLQGSQQGPSL